MQLRQRLEAEHIPLWQDRVGLEGGKDWWLQIKDAPDVVEFMVLVMTPAAMRSETVRKEWRYARQQGGYGKTTMARAICHDEHIQQAFDDGILWVTLGEHPGNLVGKVEDLIYLLNQERPGFTGIDAAGARLAELLADRDILLVVDDVWDAIHLKPLLQGGTRCARLITTRNEDVLPSNAQSLVVDAMQPGEAVQLLSFGLHDAFTATDMQALRSLVARLGEWALLLKLANGVLRDRVGRGEAMANALVYLNKALDRRGLTAFDAENAQARHAAVSATLRVSFDLLQKEQYARYQELAVFPKMSIFHLQHWKSCGVQRVAWLTLTQRSYAVRCTSTPCSSPSTWRHARFACTT